MAVEGGTPKPLGGKGLTKKQGLIIAGAAVSTAVVIGLGVGLWRAGYQAGTSVSNEPGIQRGTITFTDEQMNGSFNDKGERNEDGLEYVIAHNRGRLIAGDKVRVTEDGTVYEVDYEYDHENGNMFTLYFEGTTGSPFTEKQEGPDVHTKGYMPRVTIVQIKLEDSSINDGYEVYRQLMDYTGRNELDKSVKVKEYKDICGYGMYYNESERAALAQLAQKAGAANGKIFFDIQSDGQNFETTGLVKTEDGSWKVTDKKEVENKEGLQVKKAGQVVYQSYCDQYNVEYSVAVPETEPEA